ncbi:hypothetical protein G7Z17_g7197 [Cylindrodendrum hubeiense]|uniref:Uncharacterized protein n=1 Tax=Cylindrodendrum hubeiense TaxID=595255 RepID=A0A9P5H428_9HYPO|nr:hypothetical protein G7Z17_g7197 [Cylindrodendrum hubeiense]
MDAGGLAQMSSNSFTQNALAMPSGGLAARRGSQNVKPLSFDSINQNKDKDLGALPTPRTSRSHLLAGLRTAPKSATAASFGPQSPTTAAPSQQYARNSMAGNAYGMGQDNVYNGPKTAFPQYGTQNNYSNNMINQQYTVDQVLAPPELPIDEQAQEHMDPNLYAQLVATNMYLAQQQQRLQQQLRSVQAAAQQFQQLNLSNPQLTQQQLALYEQQQQLRNMQQQLGVQAALSQQQAQQAQQTQQVYYNPMTGQYYFDNSAAAQMAASYAEQPATPGFNSYQQQQQQGTPSVQVSPPAETQPFSFRSNSPPKRYESPSEVTPLPPPSANAFRRGHKKATSLAPVNSSLAAAAPSDAPKSAGPKTATFPMTPLNGGYGPGQARAGEHPVRQPRGPPSLDELKSKPTAKHEGSKNFATRTRRSAVHNLVRAGLERRKGSGSSCGSMSPVSETGEESTTPITDNESDSGRSGSGSLAGEMDCYNSRAPASGAAWGAIGSDRPSSRQKGRKSSDSVGSATSGCESENSSFANVFKNGALRAAKAQESADSQRKAPRLVLTKGTQGV